MMDSVKEFSGQTLNSLTDCYDRGETEFKYLND